MKNTDGDVYFGIKPLLKSERIYGFWDIVLATGAWAIATWCYVQGGVIASLLGLQEALLVTMCGMVLAGSFIYLIVAIATRYGIDVWIYTRALLGHRGLSLFAFIYIAAQFGYYSINADIYANSVTKIISAAGLDLNESWTPWVALTCVLFGTWIALKGPIAVRTSTRIMVPALMAVGVFITFSVFSKYSFSDLMAITPPQKDAYGDTDISYMLVMEWNLAYVLAWFGALGVLARLVKTERASYWGHMVGFSFIMAAFICIGVLTALALFAATGEMSDDPTEWLIKLGGPELGVVSLVFIVIANVTTQAVGLYSFAVSSKVIIPGLKFKTVTIAWSAWVSLLIFWGGIWEYYSAFLAIVGATAGAIVALVIADFYIVRKQKISLRALYRVGDNHDFDYSWGFNIPAWISFGLGISAYFIVYDPFLATPKSEVFMYTTATGLTVLVSAGSYILMSMLSPVKKYLKIAVSA